MPVIRLSILKAILFIGVGNFLLAFSSYAQTDTDWMEVRGLRSNLKAPIIEKVNPNKETAKSENNLEEEQTLRAIINPTKADSVTFPSAQNLAVFAKSDSIAAANKRFKSSKGYRILVYNGSSRAEADAAKEKIYRNFPNVEVYYQYSQPVFKVKAGDFVHRMRVMAVAEQMKRVFPNLIVAAETVNLKP